MLLKFEPDALLPYMKNMAQAMDAQDIRVIFECCDSISGAAGYLRADRLVAVSDRMKALYGEGKYAEMVQVYPLLVEFAAEVRIRIRDLLAKRMEVEEEKDEEKYSMVASMPEMAIAQGFTLEQVGNIS